MAKDRIQTGTKIIFGDDVGTVIQICEEPNTGLCVMDVKGRSRVVVPVGLLATINGLREERVDLMAQREELQGIIDAWAKENGVLREARDKVVAWAEGERVQADACARAATDAEDQVRSLQTRLAQADALVDAVEAFRAEAGGRKSETVKEAQLWVKISVALAAYRDGEEGSSPLEEELKERRFAAAELGGTNSCVDDERLAKLFLKHRKIAQDLQHKWIRVRKGRGREWCECGAIAEACKQNREKFGVHLESGCGN